jgi:hypothetical protein
MQEVAGGDGGDFGEQVGMPSPVAAGHGGSIAAAGETEGSGAESAEIEGEIGRASGRSGSGLRGHHFRAGQAAGLHRPAGGRGCPRWPPAWNEQSCRLGGDSVAPPRPGSQHVLVHRRDCRRHRAAFQNRTLALFGAAKARSLWAAGQGAPWRLPSRRRIGVILATDPARGRPGNNPCALSIGN